MTSTTRTPATTSAECDIDLDAVVVGAGYSGLYMLQSLRNLPGLSARVFEAGDSLGGTWYWNRYLARAATPTANQGFVFNATAKEPAA